MLSSGKTLFELTAEDLMSRDVICIPATASLHDGGPPADRIGRHRCPRGR